MGEAIATAIKVQSALKSVGSDPLGEEENTVKGEETDSLVTGLENSYLALFAMAGIASGICAIVLTVSSLVDVASVCLIGMAPYVVYQKLQLRELGGMRGQQNELRESVNTFSTENAKLSKNIDNLQAQVNNLKGVEQDLDKLAKKAGGQVDRLVAIVKENGQIQKKILENLEKNVMQNVLQNVLRSDTDQDFSFNKRELRRLEQNLSNIPGVEFDKENFEKLCATDSDITIEEIMAMFRNLKEPIPEEDNIFHMKPEKLAPKKGGFLGL